VDVYSSGNALKQCMCNKLCGDVEGVLFYVGEESCVLWMRLRMQLRSCWLVSGGINESWMCGGV
jgi:hypothetical protein